jgi:HAMP domain-containing protein
VRSTTLLPLTISIILLAVLAHLGFFDWQRLARGWRNLGILGSEMIPPDMAILPTAGAALWEI